jgi:hypothetical protein
VRPTRFFRCWALLLAMALAACQQPSLDPAKRHGSVGKSKAQVLAEFGEPDETYVEDDKEYLSYVSFVRMPYGYWNGTYYVTTGYSDYNCRVTFLIIADRVIQDYAVGNNCGER